MKGILLEKAGGDFTVVDTLDVPKPGRNQILVKSLVTGINPVEEFMRNGVLVTSWPIVLGCDASGTVAEVGNEVTKFKVGDAVFGCTRLGIPGFSTFQEYFLMDENLAFKKPENVTTEQAATIGVGVLTAALALVSGTDIELEGDLDKAGDEWVIILGAAGSVGQYAVQLAKLRGFKVLGSCSPSNNKFLKSIGADATFDYKLPLESQLKEIADLTGGKYSRAFDASGLGTETGMGALAKGDSGAEVKYFATTNDWVPIEPQKGIEVYTVTLGVIGRTGDENTLAVNQDIEDFIPKLEALFANDSLKPMDYEVVGETGFESILKGLKVLNSKKSGVKKVVVRVAE